MKKRELLTPDLTPLIDVVFILLIFFIVSSVFKKNELALVLNLPSSSAQEVELKPKEVIIELSEDKVALFGKETDFIELESSLKNIENKKDNIIFKIDKEVKYEQIVKVLDMLEKNELFNLLLVTKNLNKE
jgi:biopolymer transport protein ExbD